MKNRKRRLIILVCILLGITITVAAYFTPCSHAGSAAAEVCACGYSRVTLRDGQVILAEQNHSRPAGTFVGSYGESEVMLFSTNRTNVVSVTWDHLGAKYTDPEILAMGHTYIILKKNWKLPFYMIKHLTSFRSVRR
jgi:hypothetical protein